MTQVNSRESGFDIEAHIESRFADLSPRLQQAARFIVDNPQLIALRSMRTVASRAHLDPSTMVRLAQDLGFGGYEELRDCYRGKLLDDRGAWTGRAQRIRRRGADGGAHLVREMLDQSQSNLQRTFSDETIAALVQARDAMTKSRSIYVVGLRSLYPIAFYFHYAMRLFSGKTVLLTGTGGTFADDLRLARANDAMLAFSYHPYAREAVTAVRFAKSRQTKVIAVTDSKLSPVARLADIAIIVSNGSTSLLPSVAPFLVVSEVLATLMVGQGDEEAMRQLALSEEQLSMFRVYEEASGRTRLRR